MKHIAKNIKLGIVVSMTLLLSSCESFLEIYNPSAVTTEYYDTKLGQERLVVNLYARYRNVFNTGNLQYFGTDMYLACDDSPTSMQLNGYSADLGGLSPSIEDYWETLYLIVQEANILTNRCTPESAGDSYETLMAEGRFMRAMSYYYLVETFGAVPLLLKENTSAGNIITEVTRESEANIYKFIVEELEAVKGKLPETTSEGGKLTDAAVRHFYGKVLLTRGYRTYAETTDFTKAAELFESVIESPSYKLVPLFKDVFDEDNQGNPEVIWAIQYGTDKNFNGNGNPQYTNFGFNITGLFPNMFILSQKNYSSMQRNYWVNPIVHEWFRHPDVDPRYDVTFTREFYINDPKHKDYGRLGIYLPLWNDESNDSKGAVNYFPFKKDGVYNWYPANGSMGWSTDCMPMCRKFKETKIPWASKGTREDIVIRMADTYLLCAEAYLKLNKKDLALAKVNAVLERAAGGDEKVYNLLKLAEADLTMDRLLEERGCEMFGEHDRWFDLKRTGTLLTRAKLNPAVAKIDNISEKHLVRPIPYNERIKLKGLTQNEGYNN